MTDVNVERKTSARLSGIAAYVLGASVVATVAHRFDWPRTGDAWLIFGAAALFVLLARPRVHRSSSNPRHHLFKLVLSVAAISIAAFLGAAIAGQAIYLLFGGST